MVLFNLNFVKIVHPKHLFLLEQSPHLNYHRMVRIPTRHPMELTFHDSIQPSICSFQSKTSNYKPKTQCLFFNKLKTCCKDTATIRKVLCAE